MYNVLEVRTLIIYYIIQKLFNFSGRSILIRKCVTRLVETLFYHQYIYIYKMVSKPNFRKKYRLRGSWYLLLLQSGFDF